MLSALYYPFSRYIDISSVNQLLLLFEAVHFLDPIADDDWRAYLFQALEEQEGPRFREGSVAAEWASGADASSSGEPGGGRRPRAALDGLHQLRPGGGEAEVRCHGGR